MSNVFLQKILTIVTSSESDHTLDVDRIAKIIPIGSTKEMKWKDDIGNIVEQNFLGINYTGFSGDKTIDVFFNAEENQKYELYLGPVGSGAPRAKIKGIVQIDLDIANILDLSYNDEEFTYNFNKVNTQVITHIEIDRNNNQNSTIDISNLNFEGIFHCLGFGSTELSIGTLILPSSNDNNFTSFKINRTKNTDIDLSGFTGSFAGDFHIEVNDALSALSLPPDLSGITDLRIRQNGPAGTGITTTQTIVINNPTGEFTRTEIYRNGSNGITWDLSSANFSTWFQCNEFGSTGPGRDVLLPSSNANNFTRFEMAQMPDRTSIDLSSYTGTFTGYFRLAKMSNISSIIYPGGIMTGLDTFILYQNTPYNSDINIGTDIIADSITISRNGLTTTNLDSIINRIYSNKTSFSANNKSFDCRKIGPESTQQAPSGTYDGTTDWSGGIPTSPLSKLYDLRNNVTGTYNWTFVAFYNGSTDETH